jgi:hypothetical protein
MSIIMKKKNISTSVVRIQGMWRGIMSMTSHIERLEWLGKKDTRAFVWYA